MHMFKQSLREKHTKLSNAGMVSFTVTIVMLLIITLITVGFTQVAQRNQREALDRQLSSQAFYAAESGVNAAVDKIRTDIKAGSIKPQTTCGNDSSDYKPATLQTDPEVKVTCVMVDPSPENIRMTASQHVSRVAVIDPVDANENPITLGNLNIEWSPSENGGASPQTGCLNGWLFPESSGTCGYALLRVDLMQFQNLGTTNSDTMAQSTITLFNKPTSTGTGVYNIASFTDVSTSGNQRGKIVQAQCTAEKCRVSYQLPTTARYKYYARISTLYNDAPNVTVDGGTMASTSASYNAYFANVQALIDSTGKAQDVLRRVQTRLPINITKGAAPTSAIQSGGGVCKKFTTSPSSFTNNCPDVGL